MKQPAKTKLLGFSASEEILYVRTPNVSGPKLSEFWIPEDMLQDDLDELEIATLPLDELKSRGMSRFGAELHARAMKFAESESDYSRLGEGLQHDLKPQATSPDQSDSNSLQTIKQFFAVLGVAAVLFLTSVLSLALGIVVDDPEMYVVQVLAFLSLALLLIGGTITIAMLYRAYLSERNLRMRTTRIARDVELIGC